LGAANGVNVCARDIDIPLGPASGDGLAQVGQQLEARKFLRVCTCVCVCVCIGKHVYIAQAYSNAVRCMLLVKCV